MLTFCSKYANPVTHTNAMPIKSLMTLPPTSRKNTLNWCLISMVYHVVAPSKLPFQRKRVAPVMPRWFGQALQKDHHVNSNSLNQHNCLIPSNRLYKWYGQKGFTQLLSYRILRKTQKSMKQQLLLMIEFLNSFVHEVIETSIDSINRHAFS